VRASDWIGTQPKSRGIDPGEKRVGIGFSSFDSLFQQGVPFVKFFTRGFILFVLSLGMLVTVGCETDNETEAAKLSKAAGDPGAPDPKGLPSTPVVAPATEAERGKRLADSQKEKPKGYPAGKGGR
jgi:hypothetical protein